MMPDTQNILNDNECFADTVDTPKEGIELYKERESSKGAISKGKPLGDKSNGHMKRLTKVAIKALIKCMLITSSGNLMKRVKNLENFRQVCN